MKTKHKIAGSSIEYLIVIVMLFSIFIIIVDIALYFRECYIVQNFADTLLINLQDAHTCTNIDNVTELVNRKIYNSFSKGEALTGTLEGNVLTLRSNDFLVIINCKNDTIPSSLIAQYKYDGIFLYKNHIINSSPSVNLSHYY